jgi:hypothetical protein
VHPRVYNAAGTLIMSDAEFQQSDYRAGGIVEWTRRLGRSPRTYAGGYMLCVDPAWTNDFGLGNNGTQGAADTGQYWYFSGVQLQSEYVAGTRYSRSGGDTTPR